MRTQAAVLWEVGRDWDVIDVELDPPKEEEVLVRLAASGLCHTDEHAVTGDLPVALPMIGGHEGAGVVEQVGSRVTTVRPGDHVVLSWIPACGRCRMCATGHQNLCDLGAHITVGRQIQDDTSRHHGNGVDLNLMACIGTFSKHTVVHETSIVKIDEDLPLDKACLVGCGVVTGWGSAVYAGDVRPGEDVAVVGCGGIGVNAIQGARMAGARRIFAVDPVPFKRDEAKRFGATHFAASIEEAFSLVEEVTWGVMCQKVIATMSVGRGDLMAPMMDLVAKNGRLVVTNVHPALEQDVKLSLLSLTTMQKQIVGALYGGGNPRADIQLMLDLYRAGQVDLDSLVTRSYPLEEINRGYEDMREGRNLRGVLVFT
jgi:S-(hydroxymethyl)glutathione dehydrogenase/alcohol dehydrogenase